MSISITHGTAADGTFSAAGAAAWNASHSFSGLTAGQIPYPSSATALTDSSGFTYTTVGGLLATSSQASGVVLTLTSQYGTTSFTRGGATLQISSPLIISASTLANAFIELNTAGGSRSNIATLAAGLVGIGSTAAGFDGRLKLTSAIHAAVAIGSLNASPTAGEIQSVNDALVPVIGNAVAASGAAFALVCWNGAQWTVIGV